jgi:hypothetical protein
MNAQPVVRNALEADSSVADVSHVAALTAPTASSRKGGTHSSDRGGFTLAHNVTLAAAAACVMSLLLAASVHAKESVPGMMMAKNWNSRCMYNCEVAEAPCFARRYNNSSDSLQNQKRCESERAACRQKCP